MLPRVMVHQLYHCNTVLLPGSGVSYCSMQTLLPTMRVCVYRPNSLIVFTSHHKPMLSLNQSINERTHTPHARTYTHARAHEHTRTLTQTFQDKGSAGHRIHMHTR